jgi:hypothetical protein
VADFLHANGLVAGRIPAGTACAFANECGMRQAHCPVEGSVRGLPFSCGAARFHSMVAEMKRAKEVRRG